jgi:hypothetical protein
MAYRVRVGFVVHEGPRVYYPGQIFQPTLATLENQSWKLELVEKAPMRPDFRDGAWRGRRCFILGGGPSLADFDFDRLRGELVIGINRAFEKFDPEIIFSIDSRLYTWLQKGMLGPGPTQKFKDSTALKVWPEEIGFVFGREVQTVPRIIGRGLGKSIREGIFTGSNSGFAALNLAICLEANPIYLLGFDLHTVGQWQKWFHEGYPSKQRDHIYNDFRADFEAMALAIKAKGVRVVNLNRGSSLKCFDFGEAPLPLSCVKQETESFTQPDLLLKDFTQTPDKVTVITPTGDRPEALALLRRWIGNQTRQPDQWLIIDDGKTPIIPADFPSAMVIRREPQADDPPCTLGKNLEAALPHIAHEKILVMEDDDWYSRDYIKTMAALLDSHALVGIWGTKCYHPGLPGFREMGRNDHASFSQTGFRRSMIPALIKSIPGDCSVDLRLWWEHGKGKGYLIPGANKKLHVAMKGMPGRGGAGCAHDPKLHTLDPNFSKLREWCGDPKTYQKFAPKNLIVIYTAIAGAGRDHLVDPVPAPGVDYVCFTDQPFESKVWEIRPFTWTHPTEAVRTAKHPKVLPHEYFPDHEISIWVDGNIIPGPEAAEIAKQYLGNGHALAMHRHPRRSCIYKEAAIVFGEDKDHADLIHKTTGRLKKIGVPANAGLYECGILFRKHNDPKVIKAMQLWWNELNIGTQSDQIAFAGILWKTGLPATVIDTNLRQNPHFQFEPHAEIYWGKLCK